MTVSLPRAMDLMSLLMLPDYRPKSSSGNSQRAFEQGAAVGPAVGGLDQVLGMRHQPKHIPSLVDDAGDVVDRPVRVGAFGIPEHDLAFALETGKRLGVGEVVAVMVRHGRTD